MNIPNALPRFQFGFFIFIVILHLRLPGGCSGAEISGEAVYQRRCASCHDQASERIPNRQALQKMSVARILRSMDFGIMMSVSYVLKRDEREAVASYLGDSRGAGDLTPRSYCRDRSVSLEGNHDSDWNGWSPGSGNTRFQTTEAAGMTADQVRRLRLKWAYGFEGEVNAFALPTFINGHLFLGSAGGVVQALDAESGCVQWTYQASGPVRSAILAVPSGERHALLFGDQIGWFYALEAESGRQLWKRKIEQHEAARLTGAPVARDGTVFVPVASWEETRSTNPDYECCTFRGSIVALRIRDGSVIWKTYTIREKPKQTGRSQAGIPQWGPSGAGVWASPTLDLKRGLMYVATGNNFSPPATSTGDAILALDPKDGRIVWSRTMTPGDVFSGACMRTGCEGEDHDFGASVMLEKLPDGRELLFAGQKSGMVYALDPDRNGEIVWQARVGKGGMSGGIVWGMASDALQIYAAVSDVVRMSRSDALPTAAVQTTLDPKQGGGLTALRIQDGKRVWYAPPPACRADVGCSPAQAAALTAIPGVVFSGSMDGHIRAFSTEDGSVLWDFDTVRTYETVNAVEARGGSVDGPGPVVARGMLFVNSGYSRLGGIPGNVLLAFATD